MVELYEWNEHLRNERRVGPVDVTERIYRESIGVNQSTLKKMKLSAAKCLWELKNPKPPTDAQNLGTAIHAALLEPDIFNETYAVKPKFDRRTKAGKENAELWDKEHADKIGIDQADMDVIDRVACRVADNDFFGKFLRPGQKESSWWSHCEETGLIKKCRLDNYVPGDFIVDLKTTDCAAPEVFSKDIWKYLYHVQAAYYVDIVREVTGTELPYIIVAVEKSKDCDVTVHLISDEALNHGRHLYQKWLRDYARAARSNIWGGYAETIHIYKNPNWAVIDNGEGEVSL